MFASQQVIYLLHIFRPIRHIELSRERQFEKRSVFGFVFR